jgi:hypothetical protein
MRTRAGVEPLIHQVVCGHFLLGLLSLTRGQMSADFLICESIVPLKIGLEVFTNILFVFTKIG